MASSGDSLKELCEQYDQEMADVEMDLAEKLLKIMKGNRVSNEEQISSMEKNSKETEKQLQLLDEKTNELVESANTQSEKIEELKRAQQQVLHGIRNAKASLFAAQNKAQDDLENLQSIKKETQKFLENNLAVPDFSSVLTKLQNYQKTFSSQVQESMDHLASMTSFLDEASRLEGLEKILEEMRMEAMNLEEQIGDVDVKCAAWHEKISELNAKEEEEKRRRKTVSEKYRQRKKHVAELTRSLEDRKNDKRLLMESLNSKEQELSKSKERLEKKNSDVVAVQKEVDTINDDLTKLESAVKSVHEKHEQKIQEIKEEAEADICAAKSILMTVREKQSLKLTEIQQARDDLNKKSELEAHQKINKEMEQNLKQLMQEKADLQIALHEKESHRDMQLTEIQAVKCTFEENKLEALKKREFLMGEVKRMSEKILELKQRIEEEEGRLRAKRDVVRKQLELVAAAKNASAVACGIAEEEKKSRKDVAVVSREVAKGLTVFGHLPESLVEVKEEGVNEITAERTVNEEIDVRKNDSQKLPPTDEKICGIVGSTFTDSKIKNLSVAAKIEGRGTEMPKVEQRELPVAACKEPKCDLVEKSLSISSTLLTETGSSKRHGRQVRKRREPEKEKTAHALALTLFDSDVSASTIKPLYASTPLLHKKDESVASFSGNTIMKKTPKKRGRVKGKKTTARLAGTGNPKLMKEKDAFDLDSDFD
uniref:Uncharacterized protein n=1 Tax=Setaria digitata TaxID=48799 RepID=A0A915PS33_9BILA